MLVLYLLPLLVAAAHAGNLAEEVGRTDTPAACVFAPTNSAAAADAGNLVEELKDLGKFSTLLSTIDKVGLTDTLATCGPLTVFAPTDKAFARLDKKVNLTSLPLDELKKKVLYHMMSIGAVHTTDMADNYPIATMEGHPVYVNIYNTTVTINGVKVVKADIETSNGVIHIVEDFFDPIPTDHIVSTDARFSTLLAAVKSAGLEAALSGPFTLFAPTNEAFAKVPKEILEGLLADQEALTKVLYRHFVVGRLFKEGIFDKEERFTAGGDTNQDAISFSVVNKAGASGEENSEGHSEEEDDAKEITVKTVAGSAKIVIADLITPNGVVHAIDTVV